MCKSFRVCLIKLGLKLQRRGRPLKELRGRHVESIQFLLFSEVFSVYAVSRDTNDNIFTCHNLVINVVQVHNVQVDVLTTLFEVSVKDCHQVVHLLIECFTKSFW